MEIKELVDALRYQPGNIAFNPRVRSEAADVLEKLSAENKQLRNNLIMQTALAQNGKSAIETNKQLVQQIAVLQAEIDAMAEELEKINRIKKNKELCDKYPFLIPRNVWTGQISDGYDYSWTLLDDFEPGWRIAFGEQFCEELKEALAKANYVDDFRLTDIKEKWGALHIYNFGCNQEAWDVIHKYEKLSKYTCGRCGASATKVSTGWIYPYCSDCADKFAKYEYFADINEFYKEGD
jgi:hypothetical protein